jgi:predicted DCC family thiol-disulfide oxidoreductase YuxK
LDVLDEKMNETFATVLFDGECNLCDKTVRFIYARDPEGLFRFAPLQSELGQSLARRYGTGGAMNALDSVLLIEDGVLYDRSTAALRIVRRLRGPARALGIFLWLPRPLRDLAYRIVARVRYKVWGKKSETCDVPPPGLKERFLAF